MNITDILHIAGKLGTLILLLLLLFQLKKQLKQRIIKQNQLWSERNV